MPLRYLLDTNTLSDLIRMPQGTIAKRIESVGEDTICTSIIVAAELRFDASKSGSKKLADRVDLVLSALDILSLETPADRHYGEIRQHLMRLGTPIGPSDLLIAAHARALNLTVVTANRREFSCVPELRVDNWLDVDQIQCTDQATSRENSPRIEPIVNSEWSYPLSEIR